MTEVSLEVVLASGYAVFLLAVAGGLDLLARPHTIAASDIERRFSLSC